MNEDLSPDDLMAAIDDTAEKLPQLSIVIAGNCSKWMIDTTTTTIYVPSPATHGPTVWECGREMLEAVQELRHHHGIPRWRRCLFLVPQQRDHDDEAVSSTGT